MCPFPHKNRQSNDIWGASTASSPGKAPFFLEWVYANLNRVQSLGSTVQYTWPTLLATAAGFSTGRVSQPGKLVFLDSFPLEQTTSLYGVGDAIKLRTTWMRHSSPLGTGQWSLLAWRQEGKMGENSNHVQSLSLGQCLALPLQSSILPAKRCPGCPG